MAFEEYANELVDESGGCPRVGAVDTFVFAKIVEEYSGFIGVQFSIGRHLDF